MSVSSRACSISARRTTISTRPHGPRDPSRICCCNCLDEDRGFGLPALGYALLRSYVRRPRAVPLEEIADFTESWILPPSERAGSDYHLIRRMINSSLRRELYNLSDLGIFSQTEKEIALAGAMCLSPLGSASSCPDPPMIVREPGFATQPRAVKGRLRLPTRG